MRTDRTRSVVVLAVLVVVLAGCASGAADSAGSETTEPAVAAPTGAAIDDEPATTDSDDATTPEERSDDAEADGHASEAFTFGEPADPADADRTVQVRATDQMTFEPATVDVRAGEVITFEVENAGQIPHDFTLGDEHAQREHAREMEGMDAEMAHADPNTMTLEAGETGSITWRVHDAGEVLYGCHQPGHHDAGMVGSVDVTP